MQTDSTKVSRERPTKFARRLLFYHLVLLLMAFLQFCFVAVNGGNLQTQYSNKAWVAEQIESKKERQDVVDFANEMSFQFRFVEKSAAPLVVAGLTFAAVDAAVVVLCLLNVLGLQRRQHDSRQNSEKVVTD